MSFTFSPAVKTPGGIAPELTRPCAAIPAATRIVSVRPWRRYDATAATLDELISELRKAREILGADCKWGGWDDGALYLTPTDGKGEGSIRNE